MVDDTNTEISENYDADEKLQIIMLKYVFAWLLVHFLLSEGNSLLMVMLLVTSMVQLYFKYSEFCFFWSLGEGLSLFLSLSP